MSRGTLLAGEERQAQVREPVECLVAAGATLVGERNDATGWWVVRPDPEGNESCPR